MGINVLEFTEKSQRMLEPLIKSIQIIDLEPQFLTKIPVFSHFWARNEGPEVQGGGYIYSNL